MRQILYICIVLISLISAAIAAPTGLETIRLSECRFDLTSNSFVYEPTQGERPIIQPRTTYGFTFSALNARLNISTWNAALRWLESSWRGAALITQGNQVVHLDQIPILLGQIPALTVAEREVLIVLSLRLTDGTSMMACGEAVYRDNDSGTSSVGNGLDEQSLRVENSTPTPFISEANPTSTSTIGLAAGGCALGQSESVAGYWSLIFVIAVSILLGLHRRQLNS